MQENDRIVGDVEFSEFVRKRTKRFFFFFFFVGGFKSSIIEDKLIEYAERRGLTVTWVNIWTGAKSGRVTIRLNKGMCKIIAAYQNPDVGPIVLPERRLMIMGIILTVITTVVTTTSSMVIVTPKDGNSMKMANILVLFLYTCCVRWSLFIHGKFSSYC